MAWPPALIVLSIVLANYQTCWAEPATNDFDLPYSGKRPRHAPVNDFDLPFKSATYSPFNRPNDDGPPVQVNVSTYLSHIEIKRNILVVIGYFRTQWNDPRLKHNKTRPIILKVEQMRNHLWTPDLFTVNAIEPGQVINQGFVRVSPTGDVVHNHFVRETLSCPGAMMMFWFNCSIEVESYAFSNADIVVKRIEPSMAAISVEESAADGEDYKLLTAGASERQVTLSTGNYSRIIFDMAFETKVKVPEHGQSYSDVSRKSRWH